MIGIQLAAQFASFFEKKLLCIYYTSFLIPGSTGHVLAQQQLILQPAFHALFNVQSQQQSSRSVSAAISTKAFGSADFKSTAKSPACTVLRPQYRWSPKTSNKDFKRDQKWV